MKYMKFRCQSKHFKELLDSAIPRCVERDEPEYVAMRFSSAVIMLLSVREEFDRELFCKTIALSLNKNKSLMTRTMWSFIPAELEKQIYNSGLLDENIEKTSTTTIDRELSISADNLFNCILAFSHKV